MARRVGGKTNDALVAEHKALGAKRAVYWDQCERRVKWWTGFTFLSVKQLTDSLYTLKTYGSPAGAKGVATEIVEAQA